ncbi:hypothetical protein Val02_30500 [Virgisporangium aliadipatigenens]|uniref:Uncharacterized protein n=1 Tax=Virgisporangium aliadipatigenens TaxID=741659 RepID=A0A8J4DQ32_9ACTN|nr:DUF6584 family protein [Virgisporangium aliadipatigenens]GIJ46164.1 hypothetical protein Val02_30500 [Virgisporangium aliadipatigenens]
MIVVAKDRVLAKVEADLRRGHYHPALQRLASLAAADPDDLELRAKRAAVYRQIGNLVEAGRWGFLTEDVTDRELSAFEKAHPSAWSRLLVLRIGADPTEKLGPTASDRLAHLIELANQETSTPVVWTKTGPTTSDPGSWAEGLACLLAAAAGLAFVALAVIGLITVIRWVW